MQPSSSQTLIERLERHDIRPSAQRLAIAGYVLDTHDHPSADAVWNEVKKNFPMVSRATVYNTLQLFTEKGLLRQLVLAEGKVVFDPKIEPHHHFVDDASGAIEDIPWNSIRVGSLDKLEGIDVNDYMVVVRGTRRGGKRR